MLASSHYVLTKRGEGAEFEMRRADRAEVGDRVLLSSCNDQGEFEAREEGTVVEKVCYEVPHDQMVIVWTPSMYIVVDNIVSTCHTDDADPRAVQVLNYMCQTRIGSYLYSKLEN